MKLKMTTRIVMAALTLVMTMLTATTAGAVDLTGWGYNVIGDKFPDALDGTKDMLNDGAGNTILFTIHNFEQATDVGTNNVTVTPRGSVFIDPEDYANKPAGTYTGSVNGIALSLTISTPVVPIVVTSANVNEIFCGVENATDVISQYCLGPQIPDGAILDIQGYIDYNRSFVINKRVGIFSSTKDATFNLHTVKGDTYGDTEIPKFSFIVSTGASGSVIKDLFIWNTQTWIYNVADVLLKDITISVRSIGLSEEIGHTAVRYCDHLVMDGWNVFTENTNAPSIVFYVVNRSSIINMTIEGQSKIGSLLTLTCPNEVYDAPFEDYVATSTKNTIKNCAFKTGYPDAFPIANDNADYTTIDCIQVNASKNIQTGTNANVINSEFYNASGIDLRSNSTAYNNVVYGSSSTIQKGCTVYNNTFNAVTTSGSNVTFKNNTVKNKLTVSSPATIKDNFLNTVEFKSGSNGATLTSNVISGQVTGASENATISDNATVSDNTGVPATATADDNKGAFYYVAKNTTVDGDITISKADGAQSPKVTFLIADGAHLTVNGGVSAPDVQMNVYPLGSGQMTVGNAIECKGLNIYGGTITTGSITATDDIRISNCQMAAGNIATAADKDITLYECQETTTGNVSAGNICIDGGQVSVNGTMSAANISFGWTRMTNIEDEIFYVRNCSGTVTAKGNQRFVAYNTEDGPEAAGIVSSSSNIDISGKYLRRLDGYTVCPADGITLKEGGYSRIFTLNNKSYYAYEFLHIVTVAGHESDYADIHATRPKYGENYFKEGEHQFPMPAQDIDITAVDFYNYGFKYIDADGTEQTTADGTKVYFLDGGGATTLPGGWYIAEGNVTYTGGLTLTGDTHLILADKAAMTCSGLSKYSSEDNLTIYGQSTGDDMGKLTTKADGCIDVHNLAINGGEVTTNATSFDGNGILADNVTINGGKVKAIGDYVGIWATNDFTISGGKVKAEGYKGIFAQNTVSITGGTVEAIGNEVGIWATNDLTISGGQVKATCSPPPNTAGIFSDYGDIHLGYTNADDYIFATSYEKHSPHTISVDATAGQRFVAWNTPATEGDAETASSIVGSGTVGDLNAINGKTLRPLAVAETGADGKVTTWPGYVVTTPARLTLSGKTDADGKPKPDFAIGSTPYYIYKKDATVTVASTGHDDDYAEFVAIDIDKNRAFYLNETAAKSHAFTMPGQDIKISSVRYYNLGVEYMNWDSGEPVVAKTDANTKVYVLDGTNGDLYEGWHVVKEDISYSDILQLSGDVHIILADGATMTIGTEDNPLYDLGMVGIGSYCPISIYGQSKGTGTLSISVSANYYAISSSLPINLYSCKLIISSCEVGISSGNKVGIYGCDVTMTNVAKDGIDLAYGRNLILRASSLRIHSAGNGIICSDNGEVFYYGGQVDITGGASGNGISGNVTLCSWTSAGDYFKASSYVGSMTIGDGYYFTYEGHTGEPLTGTVSDLTTIARQKLVPAQKKVIDGETYIAYSNGNGNWVLNDPNAQVYVITGYDLANGLVILTEVTGNEIPDGVPVIIGSASLLTEFWLVGEEKLSDEAANSISGRKPYFFVCDGTTTVADLLKAALGSTADLGDYVLFTLVNNGFRPVIATPTSTPAKGTCVLAIPKMELLNRAQGGSEGTSGARTHTIPIDLGGETGIRRPTPDPSLYGGEWYDLQGRRLSGQPTRKGVYVRGGRAVVVK